MDRTRGGLEDALLRELRGREGTFLGELHENDNCDPLLFDRMIGVANELAARFENGDRDRQSGELVADLVTAWLYAVARFYWHLDPDDSSSIADYDAIQPEVSRIVDELRDASRRLIKAVAIP